jgi:hypothetical protein
MGSNYTSEARRGAGDPEPRRQPSLGKIWLRIGLAFVVLLLLFVAAAILFINPILNQFGKQRIQQAYATENPGHTLQLGDLDYSWGDNRLVADTLTWTAPQTILTVDQAVFKGVHWLRLLRGASLVNALAGANLHASNLTIELPRQNYRIHFEQLRASVPESRLVATQVSLAPFVDDDEFFAAEPYRATRLRLALPEGRVSGLGFAELLEGTAYRAQSLELVGLSFDALVSRYKPKEPFEQSPLMVHEALARLEQPLHLEQLAIRDAHVTYGEQTVQGQDPALLTFGSVHLVATDIRSEHTTSNAIRLQAQGDLMEAGTLSIRMSIPTQVDHLSLQYSGSLTPMKLSRLNPFLGVAEQLQIRSGRAEEATFDIEVIDGTARGHVHAVYTDLRVSLVDEQAEGRRRLDRRLASFFLNLVKIRESNEPETSAPMKTGEVEFTREPENTFIQFIWFALRSGVLDVISR